MKQKLNHVTHAHNESNPTASDGQNFASYKNQSHPENLLHRKSRLSVALA
jgi:hypothetical protein